MSALTGPADMGCAHEAAVSAVTPAVVWASNSSCYFGGMLYKDHASVAARILEDAYFVILIAQQQYRYAQEC